MKYKENMNGKNSLIAMSIVLVILAIICRFRDPVLFKWNPKEDSSLGKAGESPHKERMLGFAIHDMMFSILFALCLAGISRGPFTFWLIVLLLIGELMHIAFGIRSATFRWLFEGHVQSAMDTQVATTIGVLGIAFGIGYAVFNPQKDA